MANRSDSEALFNLVVALADDVGETSAEELLSEVAEDYGNPLALSIEVDEILERLIQPRNAGEPSRSEDAGARVAELRKYLTDAAAGLAPATRAALQADKALRALFGDIMREFAQRIGHVGVPQLAAASAGTLQERRFDRGTIRLVESEKNPRQLHVVIEFDEPGYQPRALVLSGADGSVAKLQIDPPDEEGVTQTLISTENEDENRIVRLLRDPLAVGTFV
jgi:hypothetical protein